MFIPACASALKFSASQVDNPQWLAVGLTTALKAALMVQLSAYENAESEDILDTERKGAASVRLLLRRASSADYLSDEHRLPLTSSKRKAILNLVAIRNRTLHIIADDAVPPIGEIPCQAIAAIDAIRYLVLTSPAFDLAQHGVDLALIADYLQRLDAAIRGEN